MSAFILKTRHIDFARLSQAVTTIMEGSSTDGDLAYLYEAMLGYTMARLEYRRINPCDFNHDSVLELANEIVLRKIYVGKIKRARITLQEDLRKYLHPIPTEASKFQLKFEKFARYSTDDTLFEFRQIIHPNRYKLYRNLMIASNDESVRFNRIDIYYIFLKGSDPYAQEVMTDYSGLKRYFQANLNFSRIKIARDIISLTQTYLKEFSSQPNLVCLWDVVDIIEPELSNMRIDID